MLLGDVQASSRGIQKKLPEGFLVEFTSVSQGIIWGTFKGTLRWDFQANITASLGAPAVPKREPGVSLDWPGIRQRIPAAGIVFAMGQETVAGRQLRGSFLSAVHQGYDGGSRLFC